LQRSLRRLNTNLAPSVTIILLNYKGADDTIACLQSLHYLVYDNYKIRVVDNDSQDGSVEAIHQAFPDIPLILSETNGGYSAGNNLAIRTVLQDLDLDYVWLLNNDTTVDPNSLGALVAQAQRYPNSLIGSLVLYPDGRFQRVGNYLDRTKASVRYYNEPDLQDGQVVESLTGCSMLVPKAVFETIGLLDESYFLYFEDNDFCMRAAHAGFSNVIALGSRVYHKESASVGKNRPLLTYYYQRNRLVFAQKYFPAKQNFLLHLYTFYRLFRSKIKSMRTNTLASRQDHVAFCLAIQDFYQDVLGKCPHEI
jgi:GT2 family glycosyltransferase